MASRRQIAFIGSVAVAVVGAVAIWFGAAAVILAVIIGLISVGGLALRRRNGEFR